MTPTPETSLPAPDRVTEALRHLAKVGFGYDITQADRVALNEAADALAALTPLPAPVGGEALPTERNTHLVDWLSDGHTHCQHGTKEWCEAYLHNARDVISAQDAALASTQEEIARLRKALEPFAKESEAWVGYDDTEALTEGWGGGPATNLNVGHLRCAARSLSPSKPIAANPLPGEQG